MIGGGVSGSGRGPGMVVVVVVVEGSAPGSAVVDVVVSASGGTRVGCVSSVGSVVWATAERVTSPAGPATPTASVTATAVAKTTAPWGRWRRGRPGAGTGGRGRKDMGLEVHRRLGPRMQGEVRERSADRQARTGLIGASKAGQLHYGVRPSWRGCPFVSQESESSFPTAAGPSPAAPAPQPPTDERSFEEVFAGVADVQG